MAIVVVDVPEVYMFPAVFTQLVDDVKVNGLLHRSLTGALITQMLKAQSVAEPETLIPFVKTLTR